MTEARSPLCVGIGTYRGGGGAGIATLCLGEDGSCHRGESYAAAPNASFSVHAPRLGLHYIVDEAETGHVGVHRYADRKWEQLASVAIDGAAPCHIALDATETRLAVANYASGSVTLLLLDTRTGLPAGPVQVRINRGSGPNAARQQAPHAHWVGFSPDGHWLYQTDLGTDEILAFQIETDGTLGAAQQAYRARPGAGPRHLLLHPRLAHRAYLIGELDNTLSVLDRREGTFMDRATLSTLPVDWRGDSIVAHIAINQSNDRLYVSNRGHDSIAVFALDTSGHPTLLEHVATGGAYPRFFAMLEEVGLMVVAHEKSQTVTALEIAGDGRLTSTGLSVPVPGAASVIVLSPPAPDRG